MKILFLDTNIFIQCRDLEQLPWPEICRDEEYLLLFIPRAVQEEIDHHKQEGNSRRAKRAKKASSFIRRIILSKDTKLVIRDSKPIVGISFTPPLSNDCQLPDFLDLSRPDDCIIAEIIRYRNKYPDHDVSILTHDTNPLLTAKRCGLSYFVVPDNWLLPPELDSKDKKIIELENRIKELQRNYPVIEVSSVDDSGNETNHFSAEVVRYKSLAENELDDLLNEVKRRYPMKTHFSDKPPESIVNQLTGLAAVHSVFGYKRKFIPPTAEKIEKYQNEEYPAWIEKVRKYLLSLPEKFEESTRSLSFSIKVNNNGNVPAENTIVEFKAFGGIFFKPSSNDDESNEKNDALIFPSPPKPPEGRWITQRSPIFDTMEAFRAFTKGHISPVYGPILKDIPLIPKERDRNAFYWKNGKPRTPVRSWIFECEEFRHKIETESFDLTVLIPLSEKDILRGTVECSVSAKNLPKPINFYINLDITYVEGETRDEVKNYLMSIKVK
ncbi:MAG: PIN domain-containing protein [Candidatus Scalinduaceae bacterium]